MRKAISTIMALTTALSFAAFVPVAEARDAHRHVGHQGHGNHGHYAHNGYRGGNYHRGRGHWHNGQWIALGVGAAIVGAAAANSNCYRC